MKNIFPILLFVCLLTPFGVEAQTKSFQELLTESQNYNNIEKTLPTNNFSDVIPKKKKAGLAALYSFLLPGMGELYAGNYNSGKYFTIADGALWVTLIGMNAYGSNQRDNYIAFSSAFGGVNTSGKSDKFYADIAGYNSVDDFNDQQLLDRNFEDVYSTDTHYWKWQSAEKRKEYKSTWTSSENAFNNIKFVSGALILNRLISVINAIRIVTAHNKALKSKLSWNVSFGLDKFSDTMPTSLSLNFNTLF